MAALYFSKRDSSSADISTNLSTVSFLKCSNRRSSLALWMFFFLYFNSKLTFLSSKRDFSSADISTNLSTVSFLKCSNSSSALWMFFFCFFFQKNLFKTFFVLFRNPILRNNRRCIWRWDGIPYRTSEQQPP